MSEYTAGSENERLIPRDLSWLAFNERVLAEAADEANPLLERLKFMAIFVNNLTEFVMVRVAGLRHLLDSGYNQKTPVGLFPRDIYEQVRQTSTSLVQRLYTLWSGDIQAQLRTHRVLICRYDQLSGEQQKFARRYFEHTLFPIITPMAVDPGRPFPLLATKTMAFAVMLQRDQVSHLAVVPIPRSISRFVKVPAGENEYCFILIDEILRCNLEKFFKGYTITAQTIFRVIRDSEFYLEEEDTDDLLRAVESELRKRARGKVVSLELSDHCPVPLAEQLAQGLDVSEDCINRIPGDLDLSCLFELIGQIPLPQLRYVTYLAPGKAYDNIFEAIKENVFITHLPYTSFQPTVDLIAAAATDPDVLAIKMTLYRTGEHSPIIKALKAAAAANKQVTVLVEIKARFDEKLNIRWVRELEEAGCHVMYGLVGMKVHAKMTLVVRREEGRIRRYVHMGTGNYNEKTAEIYTDIGYFTANEDFAHDISDMFNVITGYSLPPPWRRIVSSPNDLREFFFELIDREISHQQQYRNGYIWAQMNSLEDVQMIEKLYQASCAGVRIDLVVRGICCLVPGVPAMSEHIRVKSVIGRFLEHSRIYAFHNNGNQRFFLSSADWMRRNLERRIELLFEIFKDDIKAHLRSIIDSYWKDTVRSWFLQPDRIYVRHRDYPDTFDVQEFFMTCYR